MKAIRILKDWTLPIAMICGVATYFLGRLLPFSTEARSNTLLFVEWLQPVLLFCMLFVSFCKIKPSEIMREATATKRRWQPWLLLIQSLSFCLCCLWLWTNPDTPSRLITESFLLSMICPTATACAVVTQKLGGDSASTTSYTILINLTVAILAPLFLPMAHPQAGLSFLPAFVTIINKVFPILMAPLLLAWAVRYCFPRFHGIILRTKDLAFYMWAIALAIAIAVTCRALVHSHESLWQIAGIAVVTLIACLLQFYVGKRIGSHYGMRMEAGQAAGQKNTVFMIWLGYTFLSPVTATAGGFYSVWHNVVNSYQLYKKRKKN